MYGIVDWHGTVAYPHVQTSSMGVLVSAERQLKSLSLLLTLMAGEMQNPGQTRILILSFETYQYSAHWQKHKLSSDESSTDVRASRSSCDIDSILHTGWVLDLSDYWRIISHQVMWREARFL